MNVDELNYTKLTPEMLEKTMLHFGWSKIKNFPERAAVWQSKSGETKLWVPVNTVFQDYQARIDELVQTVSTNNNIASEQVTSYLQRMYMPAKTSVAAGREIVMKARGRADKKDRRGIRILHKTAA